MVVFGPRPFSFPPPGIRIIFYGGLCVSPLPFSSRWLMPFWRVAGFVSLFGRIGLLLLTWAVFVDSLLRKFQYRLTAFLFSAAFFGFFERVSLSLRKTSVCFTSWCLSHLASLSESWSSADQTRLTGSLAPLFFSVYGKSSPPRSPFFFTGS